MAKEIKTLGQLKESGHVPVSVKTEIRTNLIRKLRNNEELFPGVIGFDDTVIPQIANAILAGQDLILLGERGQAKSRIVRSLATLLDEKIPVLVGAEIPENPFAPITTQGKDIVSKEGDDAEIRWLSRDERYAEKLATPDITIADLIGEIDPIKVAEGRYLSDELTIHYGLVPRANHGIFAINELPDLTERIQVGLLNVLEERDVQIRGYRVRLPLDVFLVATANPEDYTNRGRIITPLKDRFGAQVRTHYPETIEKEVEIMVQEASALDLEGFNLIVPEFMRELVAEITHQSRKSPDINQRSGVSVRASIANYEALLANAFRRSLRLDEKEVVPRMTDLPFMVPSLHGKLEFEALEEGEEDKITERIQRRAIKSVFDRRCDLDELDPIIVAFEEGLSVETGESLPQESYLQMIEKIDGLGQGISSLSSSPPDIPACIEFVLEGLHLHNLLNKHNLHGGAAFTQ